MGPPKDISSTQTPQVPEPNMPATKTTKQPMPPKSAQDCRDFLYRRCNRERNGGCPYKHDEALLKKKTDERLASSRDKLQTGYTNQVSKTICKHYLENSCTKLSCPRTHDFVRHLQFMDKAREYIHDALITLEAADEINSKDAGANKVPAVVTKFCYYYNTGGRCSRNVKPAQCPFEHSIRLRRAVLEALEGKTLSDIIVSNAEIADKTLEAMKGLIFPGPEFKPKKVSAKKNTTTTSKALATIDNLQTTSTEIELKKDTAPTTTSKALIATDASQSTTASKKPRYKKRKALQRLPMVPWPEDNTPPAPKTPFGSTAVKGGWTESPWWLWAKSNMKTAKEAEMFKEYISELEEGRVPKALMQKWSKRASNNAQFKCFQLLPFEIREIIWQYAVKNERSTLRVRFSHDGSITEPVNVKITNHNAYPSMFYVNSQSRQVALKDYEKRFGTIHNPAKIYINYLRDRVFFQTRKWDELSKMAPYMEPFDASRIRHICLPIRDFICGYEMVTCDILPFFVNMRTLTLFAGEGKADAKVLSRSGINFHLIGIEGCVRNSWKRYLPGKPYPKVRLEWIDATMAHILQIDQLLWKM